VMQPYKLLNRRLKNLEKRRSWRLILSQSLQIQKTYMQNQRLLYQRERKNRIAKKDPFCKQLLGFRRPRAVTGIG
jgi:hypothetical protein